MSTIARHIQETSGPTRLPVGAVADGEFLKRVGSAIVGASAGGGGSHASGHQNGGADEISVAGLSGLLADPQTPATHAASHAAGGGDAVKLDDLAVPDDNTDLNASAARHGLLPKLSGVSTEFLNGAGAFATPAAGGPTIALKSADQTAIGTAFADVTGTGLAVAANQTYRFEFWLWCDADAATTGIDVACNGPASPTAIRYEQTYWTSATARTERGAVAYDANTASTGSNGTAARLFRVEGVLVNGANAGTLIARAKREAVGTGPNVRAGSFGLLWKLS